MDKIVDDGGNIAFALLFVDSLFEEIGEVDFNLLEKAMLCGKHQRFIETMAS